ncbi:hypothetical protein HanRHA438_Chr02g0055301 [Helianthus annuus]|nr:hypothetical protein HanRHA438_Chr02g0055301 [Helianthus annuus]
MGIPDIIDLGILNIDLDIPTHRIRHSRHRFRHSKLSKYHTLYSTGTSLANRQSSGAKSDKSLKFRDAGRYTFCLYFCGTFYVCILLNC